MSFSLSKTIIKIQFYRKWTQIVKALKQESGQKAIDLEEVSDYSSLWLLV